ncbi:DUF3482 domain-containing protein [Actomonas aquatica]|uniref:DUF3482 domain-containing protein n=1 Tax=Actomonas aquatica TaxID=2866162 RepID=A0ABZ1C9F6_9BACT|nr:DUF3482 domain-containing protein [Opitutus sp. WL0086]WRQ88331.1 DUF3482 domain-containing protein [Opitutus sp. WL0086]
MKPPVFALVGHPNKGKSSLAATLARDDSVRIGPEPGTTTFAREYPLRVANQVLYVLVDTPGFQRARAALAWMREHETHAADRPAVVARFVREKSDDPHFRDEWELLRPVVDGAGIIYVVDGATPYGPEYEAEMEILRWTGKPSLAVINPIGEPRFVEPWRRALEQFFRIVRVVDVHQAPFAQQVELLQAFGQMSESWVPAINQAVAALSSHRQQQAEDAARVIAELLADALTHRETRALAKDADPAPYREGLEQAYRRHLRQLERRARREVEALYNFDELDREEVDMAPLETDLLSQESWLAFGLEKRDLVVAGAATGAVAGGVIDVALLGASFLTGALVGSAVGGAAVYFASDKLADLKVLHQPMGGTRAVYGPTRNVQFPFVLLSRALHHHRLVAARTHAQRGKLSLENEAPGFPDDDTRRWAKLFQRLRKTEAGTGARASAVVDLTDAIAALTRTAG